MNLQSAANAYRNAAFESAPPLKIVRMMYQGALRFLEEAGAIDPQADPNGFRDRLNRAEAVIVELRISLDSEQAPDIAKELTRLYLFAEGQISDARDELDATGIESASQVIDTLFSAWKEIEIESSAGV